MKNQKSQLQQMMSKITQKHLFLLTLLFFSLTLQAQITVRAENRQADIPITRIGNPAQNKVLASLCLHSDHGQNFQRHSDPGAV